MCSSNRRSNRTFFAGATANGPNCGIFNLCNRENVLAGDSRKITKTNNNSTGNTHTRKNINADNFSDEHICEVKRGRGFSSGDGAASHSFLRSSSAPVSTLSHFPPAGIHLAQVHGEVAIAGAEIQRVGNTPWPFPGDGNLQGKQPVEVHYHRHVLGSDDVRTEDNGPGQGCGVGQRFQSSQPLPASGELRAARLLSVVDRLFRTRNLDNNVGGRGPDHLPRRRQAAALPRCAVPARQPAYPQTDETSGQCRRHVETHP